MTGGILRLKRSEFVKLVNVLHLILIIFSSMIHLYVNPSARHEWEQQFNQPQQQNYLPQQQHYGATALQPPNHGGGGGFVDPPPSYNDVVTKS